jgi:hypothetical protein
MTAIHLEQSCPESMSDEKPKDPPDKPRHGEAKESGRVAFDARGNPVWEWKTSTGVFDRNVTTQRLKKLEAQHLQLEETVAAAKAKELALQEQEHLPGGGNNPYDSGGLKSSQAPVNTHPALAHKQTPNRNVSSGSLASKYASAAKQKAEPKPLGAWDKLKSKFQRDK